MTLRRLKFAMKSSTFYLFSPLCLFHCILYTTC